MRLTRVNKLPAFALPYAYVTEIIKIYNAHISNSFLVSYETCYNFSPYRQVFSSQTQGEYTRNLAECNSTGFLRTFYICDLHSGEMRVHAHARTHTCIHIHTHAYTFTYTHAYTCIHKLTRLHIHTHMHAHSHTHAYIFTKNI